MEYTHTEVQKICNLLDNPQKVNQQLGVALAKSTDHGYILSLLLIDEFTNYGGGRSYTQYRTKASLEKLERIQKATQVSIHVFRQDTQTTLFMNSLQYLRTVTHINLEFGSSLMEKQEIVNQLFKALGQLPNLEELNIKAYTSSSKEENANLESLGNCQQIKRLTIDWYGLKKLPEAFGQLKSLEKFYLKHSQVAYFPESMGNLKNLRIIHIDSSKCESLPSTLGGCTELRRLNILSWKLKSLPESIGNCSKLKEVNIYAQSLVALPDSFSNCIELKKITIQGSLKHLPSLAKMKDLWFLRLAKNKLESLPKDIGGCESLRKVYLNSNQLTAIPDQLTSLKNLELLNLAENKLGNLPKDWTGLESLKYLYLSCNLIKKLPTNFGGMPKLRKLSFESNQLQEIVNGIYEMSTLTHLNLSCNSITTVSDKISQLQNLHYLHLQNNPLKIKSDTFDQLKQLRRLYLGYITFTDGDKEKPLAVLPKFYKQLLAITDNLYVNYRIQSIPEIMKVLKWSNLSIQKKELKTLANCIQLFTSVKELRLNGNRLEDLPNELADLTSLDYLNLSDNQFKELPKVVYKLPKLRTLDLKKNPLSQEAITEIKKHCTENGINVSFR
ncbi:MAG: leucine-rich repeat protein [Saprospiraceae bacterium]|nr:leucine-rich repeat protein [Saprospiraceae bacterium]